MRFLFYYSFPPCCNQIVLMFAHLIQSLAGSFFYIKTMGKEKIDELKNSEVKRNSPQEALI